MEKRREIFIFPVVCCVFFDLKGPGLWPTITLIVKYCQWEPSGQVVSCYSILF